MRRPRRKVGTALLPLLVLGAGLSGCAGVDLDPAYWFPDGKKKLPGERRELFPGGVPGVTQGVPPELIRGSPEHQAPHAVEATPGVTPPPQTASQAEEPKVEERPKPRARPKVARKPTALPRPEPAEQPAQKPAQPASQPGAWPPPQASQQGQQPSSAGWPAPVPSGTFTR